MSNNIDDRAYKWRDRRELYALDTPTIMEASYHQGTTEQKQIDDEEYRKDMQYVNIKKQELIDKIRKAYCAHHCPHLVEYCWQDETDIPCEGYMTINKAMET